MKFDKVEKIGTELLVNPFAGKDKKGEWIKGYITKATLEKKFGQCETVTEMKNATDSEELKLFFDYLVDQGKLTQ